MLEDVIPTRFQAINDPKDEICWYIKLLKYMTNRSMCLHQFEIVKDRCRMVIEYLSCRVRFQYTRASEFTYIFAGPIPIVQVLFDTLE